MTDRRTDRLTDWLTGWLLPHWLTDSLADWETESLTEANRNLLIYCLLTIILEPHGQILQYQEPQSIITATKIWISLLKWYQRRRLSRDPQKETEIFNFEAIVDRVNFLSGQQSTSFDISFSCDDGDSNEDVKKAKRLLSNCRHYTTTTRKRRISRFKQDVNKPRGFFLSLSKLSTFPRNSIRRKITYIWHFQQTGINAT